MKKNMTKPELSGTEAVLSTDCQIDSADFEWVGQDTAKMEGVTRPSISYWKDAMHRLSKSKAAIVCIVILLVITLFAIVVPFISPYTMSEQHLEHTNTGFFFRADDGHTHIFGTDDLGRDIYVRVWEGARISLFIAVTAVFVNFVVGVIYGGISGLIGGGLDTFMMRVIEIINAIPYLIIVILLMMVMPAGPVTIIVAYATVGWTGMARLVRGQVISLKEQEFVVATKAMGASTARIIARHLLPNILSVVIINITLAIPSAIFTEAFLSFIGMGVPIPLASWGTLANEGVRVFQTQPTQLAIPAFFISITMLSFNLLGDKLRDAFDPRLRR